MEQVNGKVEGEITMRLYKGSADGRHAQLAERDLRPQPGDVQRRRLVLAGRGARLHRAVLAAEPHGLPHRRGPGEGVRRGGPPMLPVEPAAVPRVSRVERGPRGLRLRGPAGDGAARGPLGPAARAGAPRPSPRARRPWSPAASSRSLTGAGVAFSLRAAPGARRPRPPPAGARRGRWAPPRQTPASCTPTTAGARWCCRAWGTSPPSLGPGPVGHPRRRPPRWPWSRTAGWWSGTSARPSRRPATPAPAAALCYAADGALWLAAGAAPRRARRGGGRRPRHRGPGGRGGGAPRWWPATRTTPSASGSRARRGARHLAVAGPARDGAGRCRPTAR